MKKRKAIKGLINMVRLVVVLGCECPFGVNLGKNPTLLLNFEKSCALVLRY